MVCVLQRHSEQGAWQLLPTEWESLRNSPFYEWQGLGAPPVCILGTESIPTLANKGHMYEMQYLKIEIMCYLHGVNPVKQNMLSNIPDEKSVEDIWIFLSIYLPIYLPV